jgi:WD40-like Beta Propeller Repeat
VKALDTGAVKGLRGALALGVAAVVALAATPPASATFPGRNGLIAYTGSVGDGSDIFTVDPENRTITRLTAAAGDDTAPSWSPDGGQIAFESRRDGSDSEIYVMDADGSRQTRLTFNAAQDREPAWSPDGRIVFSSNRSGGYHLFVVNADGTDVRQLTSGGGDDYTPDWSPEGRRIIFTANRCCSISDVWVVDVADGSTRRVTGPTPDGSFTPKWGPDGRKISFSFVRFDFTSVLAWVDVDAVPGTGINGLLKGEQGAFSPDGATFTYTLSGAIYIDGSPQPLATGSEPDWGVQPEPATCTVPRLRGRMLGPARSLLYRNHCRLGRVSRVYSRHLKRGRIIAQSPRPGAVRRAEARVAVIVSRGPRRRAHRLGGLQTFENDHAG